MDPKYFYYKLKWWFKEHTFLYSNIFNNEIELNIDLPKEYQNWVVHPCVRYIEQGINGYKWWMAVSPYPNFDTTKENILLFRGEPNSCDNQSFPRNWSFVKEIAGTHKKGYNSDPNLYFDGSELWIIWREWETENVPSVSPICCIMNCKTSDGITFTEPTIIAHNKFHSHTFSSGDTCMCPCVIDYNNKIHLYGSMYIYEPILKSIGLSIYEYNDTSHFFNPSKYQFKHITNFDLWHFDLFKFKDKIFQVITPQSGNAIYLGVSNNGIDFSYYPRPLYSYRWFLRRNYFYKASTVIYNDYVLLFFPRKQKGNKVNIVVRTCSLNRFIKAFNIIHE